MSKHPIDRPRDEGNARLREYTRQERESGIHPAIAQLHSRAKDRSQDSRKAAEFVRIERGRTA